MGTNERAPLGFGGELDDLDPAAFAKSKRPTNDKPKSEVSKQAAEAAGFRSREPARPLEAPKPAAQQRRRRTGRNVQFNIKTRAETIEAFTAIADANGWGLGETFERATKLLEQDDAQKSQS